jgi:hypothetical protein
MSTELQMKNGSLLDLVTKRTMHDLEEGDIAFFHALIMQLEYITKLVTIGTIECIGDDADRQRYSLEHTLIRANSLGSWVDILNSALTGPPAQYFIPRTIDVSRSLTERVSEGDWRHDVVSKISKIAEMCGVNSVVGAKTSLKQFFQIAAVVRNRNRGHGSPTSQQCGYMAPLLVSSINLVVNNFPLFKFDWVYLHRNLSGKYRVTPLLGECNAYSYLKRTRDVSLPNGVYIDIGGGIRIPFIFSDPEVRDIFLPNGNFSHSDFEVLSYITNDISRQDGSPWKTPPGRLQQSETEGLSALEQIGNVFSNHPPLSHGYISRNSLEENLRGELLTTERHPIVTLTGPGGIGKTTVAIAVIDKICKIEQPPYFSIMWLSSRDIDLLESGPKPVTPKVDCIEKIAKAAVELLEPSERFSSEFNPISYFESCLAKGAVGPTLFVFDNFETLTSPVDAFRWIDTHLRIPNKVIITTRFRDFAGDFPIEINGMKDDEAMRLIDQEAKRLGIASLLTSRYKEELIAESDGHPYVIKILLGQVANEGMAVKPERIVANSDYLLTALFERTYEKISPAAKRIFLLLCSWRVFVPSVAVEAVSLRPGNERFDVTAALEELRRFSLIDEIISANDNESFVGVPLAAASFGRRKIEISPYKIVIEEDRKILIEFGAGKRQEAHQGVLPRIDKLVQSAAEKASENPDVLDQFIPILEYLASRVPKAYLRLADLILEIRKDSSTIENAKKYLMRFLESAEIRERFAVWKRLSDLCHSSDDIVGEVHALSEAALLPTIIPEEIGVIANRINSRIREIKGMKIEEAWSPEVFLIIRRVADEMRKYLSKSSSTDCSRLAWLYLNIGLDDVARDVVMAGLQKDPNNEHCIKLKKRLDR